MLFADLKQRYSWIVVQAPALNTSAEAAVLSASADGVVVAAEQNRTGMKETVDGCDALHRTVARVLGALLI